MGDAKGGMGAEVAARKLTDDGTVVQAEGTAATPRWAQWLVYLLFGLAPLGVWKLVELLLTAL